MMRAFPLLLIALSVGAPAFAQMAAPSLLPAVSGQSDLTSFREPGILPINPAVAPWRGYSTGGGGVARSELIVDAIPDDNKPSATYPFNLSYGGVQWVGKHGALGVQMANGSAEFDLGTTNTFESHTLGGAYRLNDWLSIGGDYNKYSQKVQGSTFDITDTKLAVSLRFIGNWYVGAVSGQETLDSKFPGSASEFNWTSTQPLTGYGVAFRNEGPWQFHVEYWGIDYGTHKNTEQDDMQKEKRENIILETAKDSWVAGLTISNDHQEFGKPEAPVKLEGITYELTFGVVPKSGFSLLFHYAHSEIDASAELNIHYNGYTRALSLIYIF